ncbi:hypothetical protein C8R44DRAFT_737011 [Mycena epipterygia]|nr:hypothetical protein C8R44DRAFT_737011 [Mycena epipterygia]
MLNKLIAGSLLFLALAQGVVSAATPTTSLHFGPGPAKVFLCGLPNSAPCKYPYRGVFPWSQALTKLNYRPLRRALLRNERRHRLPGVATVVPYSPAAAILSAMDMMSE